MIAGCFKAFKLYAFGVTDVATAGHVKEDPHHQTPDYPATVRGSPRAVTAAQSTRKMAAWSGPDFDG
jgi:hypothetical protein